MGLNRGIPIAIFRAVRTSVLSSAFAWLFSLVVEYFLTEGKAPWFLACLYSFIVNQHISFLEWFLIAAFALIAFVSIVHLIRYVQLLNELQSFNYMLEQKMSDPTATLSALSDACCNGIANCFKIVRPFDKTGCAIRLAVSSDPNGRALYSTVSRAGALSSERARNSEPLTMNSRVVDMLHDREIASEIVFLCSDVNKARKCGQLDNDRNSEYFGSDDNCLLISRMVAREGAKNSVFGILYVTSNKRNIFGIEDINLYLLLHDIVNRAFVGKMTHN